MIELPRILRLSLLGAGLVAAATLAACSTGDDDPSDGTGGTGGGSDGTGGGSDGTGGGNGGGECIPKTGDYDFCSPICTCPPDVTGVDLTTAVSFRADIYPMMPASCGEGSLCHGGQLTTGFAFGTAQAPLSDAEISALIAQFKMPSPVANIPNVVEGNWQASYLMMKLDGCQNHSNLSCNSTAESLNAAACEVECDSFICDSLPCGDAMPPSTADDTLTGEFPLSAEMRNKVRAWIAQGAPDN